MLSPQAVNAIHQAKTRQQGGLLGDAVAQVRQRRMWDDTHVLQYSRQYVIPYVITFYLKCLVCMFPP